MQSNNKRYYLPLEFSHEKWIAKYVDNGKRAAYHLIANQLKILMNGFTADTICNFSKPGQCDVYCDAYENVIGIKVGFV